MHVFQQLTAKTFILFASLWLLGSGNAAADALEDLYADTLAKAEKGSSTSMYDLAGMYIRGVGTSKNLKEALVWYQEASQVGYSTASYKLGELYSRGTAVPRDSKAAFRWYKKAAEQGHKKARAKVAAMYLAGDGVKKDLTAAEEWSNPPKKKEKVAKKEKKKPVKKAVKKKQRKSATIDHIADNNWLKRKRNAIYLPSKTTHCNRNGNKLVCISKKIPGQQSNQSYTYRVRSTLNNFTPDGHFDADVEFQLVDMGAVELEGYDQEGEDAKVANSSTVAEELKQRSENVSCDLSGDKGKVTCMSSAGRRTSFTK